MTRERKEGLLSPRAKVRVARCGIPLVSALAVVWAIIGNWVWVGVMIVLAVIQAANYWANRDRGGAPPVAAAETVSQDPPG